MDRHASQGMSISDNSCDALIGLGIATQREAEVCSLDARTLAIGRLQKVCSELAELHAELKESDIEASALTVIRDTVDQMRMTAMTLQRGLEWLRLSGDGQGLLMLSIDERMRRASQLNTDIGKDFEAGRIRTDHARAISVPTGSERGHGTTRSHVWQSQS